MLTQEHNAARDAARAVLGKINQDLDCLVQALIDGTPARTVKDRIAQLEARNEVLEGQLAKGEDVKVAVHPSMASRGYCHGPEGDRDAIGDVRLDRRPWAIDDPDFGDRLVTRGGETTEPACAHS